MFRNLSSALSGKQTQKMPSTRQFKANTNETMKTLHYHLQAAHFFRELNFLSGSWDKADLGCLQFV